MYGETQSWVTWLSGATAELKAGSPQPRPAGCEGSERLNTVISQAHTKRDAARHAGSPSTETPRETAEAGGRVPNASPPEGPRRPRTLATQCALSVIGRGWGVPL
ncbi:hypothetical protein DPEC_G00349730 [Dallia pectoralis]|uniref:Uncharacterized protein n=1 Tax=Dallia pectoralis TaxID=75939 RepID=A0ACC2F1J9_DALPE|nr:hypothetical protein DPEC_G00349730 [Dallia pectoralis]